MFKPITEDEARKKWCPFARTYDVVTTDYDKQKAAGGINRVKSGADGWCRCLASDCMAWREAVTPRLGYCGLAGIPMGATI